ncbi:MAG: parB-like partition protein [Deltaproteobacteria bacterium]|jgi:ParB family chromosome partitioning protein|nr:parB-like partition protein [Deltaproteobacteria bacterium]
MGKKDPLGRGLSAILKDVEEKGASTLVPAGHIAVNPRQPRFAFKEESLQELASSIKEKGLLQPILVRKKDRGYEIIAGERRFRACRLAGLSEIPVIVKDADDRESLEMALIENVQREDLNPIELATVYARFADEFGYTHEAIAKKIGIERSSISNTMRLLKLPDWIRKLVTEGKLTSGHGRALITLKSESEQKRYVRKVLNEGASVREIERVRKARTPVRGKYGDIEEMLREALKTKVHVTFKRNKGKLIIEFYSKDDLEKLVELLCTSV